MVITYLAVFTLGMLMLPYLLWKAWVRILGLMVLAKRRRNIKKFEVKITKFTVIKVEAENRADALQKAVEVREKYSWTQSWECEELGVK